MTFFCVCVSVPGRAAVKQPPEETGKMAASTDWWKTAAAHSYRPPCQVKFLKYQNRRDETQATNMLDENSHSFLAIRIQMQTQLEGKMHWQHVDFLMLYVSTWPDLCGSRASQQALIPQQLLAAWTSQLELI